MPRATGTKPAKAKAKPAKPYKHPEADSPLRPEVGTQAQFKQKKPPPDPTHSSLSPAIEWDGQNSGREQARRRSGNLDAKSLEDAKAAAAKLKALSKPFLNWTGKAERLSFDVPTCRCSSRAPLEGHRRDAEEPQGANMFDLSATRSIRSPTRCSTPTSIGQMGEPHDPGRFAGGDELAPALRKHGRPGPDDLHGPALMGSNSAATFSRSWR